jgi:hypothetical protein
LLKKYELRNPRQQLENVSFKGGSALDPENKVFFLLRARLGAEELRARWLVGSSRSQGSSKSRDKKS